MHKKKKKHVVSRICEILAILRIQHENETPL